MSIRLLSMSVSRRVHTSEILNPAEYVVAMMALYLSEPMASKRAKTSCLVSTSGRSWGFLGCATCSTTSGRFSVFL